MKKILFAILILSAIGCTKKVVQPDVIDWYGGECSGYGLPDTTYHYQRVAAKYINITGVKD